MTASPKIAVVTGAGTGIGKAAAWPCSGPATGGAGRPPRDSRQVIAAAAARRTPRSPCPPMSAIRPRCALFARPGRPSAAWTCSSTTPAARPASLEDLTFEQWKNVVDINLTGAFLCTQEAFRLMKIQDPRGGRIINNGSISAHAPRPNSAPYTATKHAITGLTRRPRSTAGSTTSPAARSTSATPHTEMTARMATGVLQANGEIAVEPTMDVEHVASAVVYMASLPLDANVLFMTVMATKMPFVGRG